MEHVNWKRGRESKMYKKNKIYIYIRLIHGGKEKSLIIYKILPKLYWDYSEKHQLQSTTVGQIVFKFLYLVPTGTAHPFCGITLFLDQHDLFLNQGPKKRKG